MSDLFIYFDNLVRFCTLIYQKYRTKQVGYNTKENLCAAFNLVTIHCSIKINLI